MILKRSLRCRDMGITKVVMSEFEAKPGSDEGLSRQKTR